MSKIKNLHLDNFSNFEIEAQNILLEEEKKLVKEADGFSASGADEYFREFNYSHTFFSKNHIVLYGKNIPFEKKVGVPEDDEKSSFYTFYTYPKKAG